MVNCSESGAGLPVSPARQALPDEVTFLSYRLCQYSLYFFQLCNKIKEGEASIRVRIIEDNLERETLDF